MSITLYGKLSRVLSTEVIAIIIHPPGPPDRNGGGFRQQRCPGWDYKVLSVWRMAK